MFKEEKLEALRQGKREWENKTLAKGLEASPETLHEFMPASKLTKKRVYTPLDVADIDYLKDLGLPGQYPFTRGIYPTGYRSRRWRFLQITGFGMEKDTRERLKLLVEQGITGLALEYDLPTQLGYDPDHPLAEPEVGIVGVSCPSQKEMDYLLDGLPFDRITPIWADNAVAEVLLAMYIATAEKRGLEQSQLSGTSQNDILKEFIARGNYIYPLTPSLRLNIDLYEYCTKYMPKWVFTNICGYHFREAGANMIQEIAFAFSDGITYIEEALNRGLNIDDFAPRIGFNFAISANVFDEVAKFRAARRIWARLMKERFHAKKPASWAFRAGAGSAAHTLTAQQPDNNTVRVALQVMAASLSGIQSFHAASMDEAHSLPTEKSAVLALRTQQIIAFESGLSEVVDPLGGSYYVETLTNQMEEQILDTINKIDQMGGMLSAIESGWPQNEITREAYEAQKEIETGQRAVLGVNRFKTDEEIKIDFHRHDPKAAQRSKERLCRLREERNESKVDEALKELKDAAEGTENLMPFVLKSVKSYATIGEICSTLRNVFGEFEPPQFPRSQNR
jgi:methylmalonyl-CoA mutase N-terminal domain/subunit